MHWTTLMKCKYGCRICTLNKQCHSVVYYFSHHNATLIGFQQPKAESVHMNTQGQTYSLHMWCSHSACTHKSRI